MSKLPFVALTVMLAVLALALAVVVIAVGATSQKEYMRILVDSHKVIELDLATGNQRLLPATEADRYQDEDSYQYGEWTITPLKRIEYGGCPELYAWNPVVKITHPDGRHYVIPCANSWDYFAQ